MKRLFFFPDLHAPYHDERAFEVALKAREHFRPHYTITLGDWADFYAVSAHSKDPRRVHLLDRETDVAKACLRCIDDLGDYKKFLGGNHEYRLERYLMDKAPALFNFVRINDVLNLEGLGWDYTPYQSDLRIGRLSITHDVGNAGPSADSKSRDVYEGNVVIGHTHRMGVSYKGNAKGKSHVGAMFGWLGDRTKIDYTHKVRAMQWQLGFGIGFLEKDGTVRLHPIPIVNYRAEVMGRLIK